MAESILAIARRHRQALLDRDRETMRGMVVAYEPVYQRIQAGLQRLQGQLETARADGEAINTAALRREGRLESLLKQVRQEMDAFADTTESQVTGAQRASVDAGDADAREFVRRRGVSIAGAFDRLPAHIIERMVGFLADGSPLRDVIATYGKEAVEKVERALVGGIALGTGPVAIAREVRKATAEPLGRALTLARTETLRAYNSTTQERYARAGVPRWQWLATLSGSSCVVCIAMHGTVHPMEEEFGSHVKCRCTMVPVWDDEPLPIKETGEQWFARQAEDIRKRILAPVKYEAYRMGELRLADLVGTKATERWGTQRYEKSFKQILAGRRSVRQPGSSGDDAPEYREQLDALPTPTSVAESERILRDLDFEVCYVWDASGTLLLAKPGRKDQITLEAQERPLVKDSTFLHNHPQGKSFSRDDMNFVSDHDPVEFVAVSRARRYRLKRPPGGWPARLTEIWDESLRIAYGRQVKERRKRNMSDQAFDEKVYSDTMKRTAKELGLDYTEEVW